MEDIHGWLCCNWQQEEMKEHCPFIFSSKKKIIHKVREAVPSYVETNSYCESPALDKYHLLKVMLGLLLM